MIIVKTETKGSSYMSKPLENNEYKCPHCEEIVPFTLYVSTKCSKCEGELDNIEKLLDSNDTDSNIIKYYREGSI